MPKNDINIRIGAKLDGLQRGIKKAQSQLSRFANFAENTGRDLTTRLTLPIVGVGAAAVTSFAKFERMQLGLKAMADEGENTADTLQRLQDIAKLPGISLEQAVNGANQLRTVGFEARQAEEILKGLSKAVTLSGKGPAELQSVVKQLVQMSAKGRILQEDLGVIQENVPSIGIAIQDAFGTNNIEAIRKSGISAQQFTGEIIKAISANEKFAKAQGGLSNEFDNFGQSVSLSLSTLGQTIAESINLSGILQKLSGYIEGVTKRFSELSPSAKKTIVIIAGVAASIGPLIFGIGALIKVGAGLVASIKLIGGALAILAANPIAIAVAAIAAIGIAMVHFFQTSDKFRAVIQGIGASIKAFFSSILEGVKTLIVPFERLVAGDFAGAAKAFAESFKRANPISLFANAAVDAASAYTDAFNDSLSNSRAAEQLNRSIAPSSSPAGDVFANLGGGAASGGGGGNPARAVISTFAPLEKALGTVKSLRAETTGLALELSEPLTNVGAKFQALPEQVNAAQESLLMYGDSISDIDQRSQAFGTTFDSLAAKISATRGAIDTAFADGFTAAHENIRLLVEELQKLSQIETIVSGIDALGSSIESLAEQGALSFQSFARAALSAISDVIGALIKQGVANAIAKNLGAAPGPVGLALAAFAGVAASSLFKGAINKITAPKLKDGGIIPPGFSGDRFPAFLNSGEAVIPLDRLFKELNGGGGGGQFILRGSDLLLATDRARVNSSRISGV